MSPLILSLNTDKKCLKSRFQNMLNITIKMLAYVCRPENGWIPLIVQWYKMVRYENYCIAYLNLCYFT